MILALFERRQHDYYGATQRVEPIGPSRNDMAGTGEGIDGRQTVRHSPEHPGRIGNSHSAGGITRDLIDLRQIASEAESMEGHEQVVCYIRNRHLRTRVSFDSKQSIFTERSGKIRGHHEARLLRQHHPSGKMRYGRNFCGPSSSLQAPRIKMCRADGCPPARHV